MIRAAYRLFPVLAGFILVCFLVADPLAALAAAPDRLTMQAEDESDVTWNLNADKVSTITSSDVIEAEGNVVLQRGSDYIRADYARYYTATKWVFIRGNVEAKMGRDTMKAAEAEFDLRSRVGWLKHGQIFMDGPHMYLAGERINKHWGDVYTFQNAKITACDGDVPAWSLVAEEAVVEIDGYAQLTRPKFQIKDQPVLASPWLVIPAKTERQSGLLIPEFGYSSRRGYYWNQPIFWAIDESSDLTFNEYLMTDRGFMQGLQYRTRPSTHETGWIRLDWMRDDERIRNDADDPVNSRDGLVRSNRDRYWLRGMYDGFVIDPRWKFKADLDLVSDQNYLHEFKTGYSGYNRSRDELFRTFRRDLQEKDLMRQSGFLLARDWQRVSVAFSSQYWQNPNLGHGNTPRSSDETVQRLPQVDAFLQKGRIVPTLPLEIAASGQVANMYRREGTRGMRYVMSPELSLPINGRYGSIIATGGIQQSFYNTDRHATTEGSRKQDGTTQTIPTMQVEGSTELVRVFQTGAAPAATKSNVGKSKWTAIQHTVQPRVRYRNIPLVDQSDNPRYDDGDRIRAKNELTYSVTNIITRKREQVVAQKPAKEGDAPIPAVARDYLDVLRITLEQSYDMREASRHNDRGTYARRPYGDVIGEVEVNFDGYVSFITRSYWSPYLDTFTQHDSGFNLMVPKWGRLYAGYGYRRRIHEYIRERDEDIKSMTMNGTIYLYGPLSVNFQYRHDLDRQENVERRLELVYTHQCFQIMGIFSKDGYEENYGIRVALTGIGD